MRCEEVKNIFLETSDLKSLKNNQEISTHLKSCRSCQNSFNYENTLREGFNFMADQNPPAQLAEMVFAIPGRHEKPEAKIQGFWSRLAQLCNKFPFRTAAVSCMVGFLTALLLQSAGYLKSPTNIPVVNQVKERASIKKSSVRKEKSPQMTERKDESVLARLETEEVSLGQSHSGLDLRKNEKASDSGNTIPGAAVSFSINQESNDVSPMIAQKKSRYSEALKSNQPAELIRNKSAEMAVGRKAMAPAPSIASSMPKNDYADAFEIDADDLEAKVEVPQQDPRCSELEKLIQAYSIKTSNGKLDLETWAARGIIPAEKLSHFTPPAGMAWFCENSAGIVKVVLRKEK